MKRKPIMFGISGPVLTPEEKEFFITNPVIGFILFKRNIQTSEQLQDLVKSLKELYGDLETLIVIDQEGGRVARLKPPIISKEYPAAAEFGELYDSDQARAIYVTQENYSELMKDLKRFAIDSPTAPIADLGHFGAHDVIGDRSFGSDVDKVVALCSAAISGIESAGGIAIIKHMPGHGRAISDSHYSLPKITESLDELDKTDFAVFRKLSKLHEWTKKWAMTAHIVVDAIDPLMPATLSKKVIAYIREVIGFDGVIITDAIEMAALHGEIGTQYCVIKRVLGKNSTEIFDHHRTQDQLEEADYTALEICGVIDDQFRSKEYYSQIHQLIECLNSLKEPFIASIAKAARASIVAGCDVVLHCSADLCEMNAIYDSV